MKLSATIACADENSEELLMLSSALSRLSQQDPETAEIVRLRFFAGFGGDEIAELMELSPSTIDRRWAYARAWLHESLYGEQATGS